MNDLNFFVSNEKRESSPLGSPLIIAVVVIVLGITISFILLDNTNKKLKTDIDQINTQMQANEYVEKLNQVKIVRQEIEILQSYDFGIDAIDMSIDSKDKIKRSFLETIAASIPGSITLESITVTTIDANISAISKDETATAELVRNLKDTGLFASVELTANALSDSEEAESDDKIIDIYAVLAEVMPK